MEEYNQFISKYKWSPDYRTVNEWSLVYEFRNIDKESESGVAIPAQVEAKYNKLNELQKDFVGLVNFLCYPNGNCEENKGYISLIFQERELFYESSNLNFTLSVLDTDRTPRFPQSFTVNFTENISARKKTAKTFGLSRYMKRDRLLLSDILNSEVLLVQCEVQYYPLENFHMPYRMYLNSADEDEMLIIENPNHRLWKILCDKSPYFNKLFVEIKASKIHLFDSDDYRSLSIMGKSILNNTDPRFNNIDEVFNLYKFADKVLIHEFKNKCSYYLKTHMTCDVVFDSIVMADMHSDDDLKRFAIQYVAEHWQEALQSKSWSLLSDKDQPDSGKGNWFYFEMFHPDLANEVCKYKENIEMAPIKDATNLIETQRLQHFNFYQ